MFSQILHITTKTRGLFAEDMFENYPDVILRDDILEGFVGKGCSGAKYGVGGGLENSLEHDDVGL